MGIPIHSLTVMRGKKMISDRRLFRRFETTLNAQYFSKERKGGWKECITTDISRKGLGLKFSRPDTIDIGSLLHIAITVPTELEPVNVKGIVRRLEKKGNDFVGGIELTAVMDDVTWAQLS